MSDEPFISRWSRRKSASRAGAAGPTADAVPAQAASTAGTAGPTADAIPAQAAMGGAETMYPEYKQKIATMPKPAATAKQPGAR